MIPLDGIHILLTYQCTRECDHCFVWGSPGHSETCSTAGIRRILDQAETLRAVRWIYFEGGEPFLYPALLLAGIREAVARGFHTGVVTNAYWAVDAESTRASLEPLRGLVHDLSVSDDAYHQNEATRDRVEHLRDAAAALHIPCSTIRIGKDGTDPDAPLMYRGRAAALLAGDAPGTPWRSFDRCPHERLARPKRVHVDPFGWVFVCQGITIGNLFEDTLVRILAAYDPPTHPIVGPILEGGPAALAERFEVSPPSRCADACHLCYATRKTLRKDFPRVLAPALAYGEAG